MVAAGGAYVMGAETGRERFDQINEWWQRTREKGMRAKDDAIVEVRDTAMRPRRVCPPKGGGTAGRD